MHLLVTPNIPLAHHKGSIIYLNILIMFHFHKHTEVHGINSLRLLKNLKLNEIIFFWGGGPNFKIYFSFETCFLWDIFKIAITLV